MIPGTGPGRGLPWWRWHGNRVLTLRLDPGIIRVQFMIDRPREGRLVAKIGR